MNEFANSLPSNLSVQCSVLNKLTLYLKQKKVKKHGKVQ